MISITCKKFNICINFHQITVETIDILESKVKLALSRKAKLGEERKKLLEELDRLRLSVRSLESEKDEVKERLNQVIDKIELYLTRHGS